VFSLKSSAKQEEKHPDRRDAAARVGARKEAD
jgi:hypothetical protein